MFICLFFTISDYFCSVKLDMDQKNEINLLRQYERDNPLLYNENVNNDYRTEEIKNTMNYIILPSYQLFIKSPFRAFIHIHGRNNIHVTFQHNNSINNHNHKHNLEVSTISHNFLRVIELLNKHIRASITDNEKNELRTLLSQYITQIKDTNTKMNSIKQNTQKIISTNYKQLLLKNEVQSSLKLIIDICYDDTINKILNRKMRKNRNKIFNIDYDINQK